MRDRSPFVARRTSTGSGRAGGSTAGRSNPSRRIVVLLVDGRWNIVRPFCLTSCLRGGLIRASKDKLPNNASHPMSNKVILSDLQREGSVSVTQQLVDRFIAAIEDSTLEPGEKL